MLSRSRLQVGLELTYPFRWVKTTPLVSYGWNSSTWLFPVAPAWRIQASRGSFKRWRKLLKTTDWSALSQLLPPPPRKIHTDCTSEACNDILFYKIGPNFLILLLGVQSMKTSQLWITSCLSVSSHIFHLLPWLLFLCCLLILCQPSSVE